MRSTHDLTATEWHFIEYCFPKPSKTGRARQHPYRELLNAMFDVARTACQWRNLPKDSAPWRTVYHYFRRWTRSGLLDAIHTPLREHVRLVAGRKRAASAGMVDRQSVKSTECRNARGDDGGKTVNGHKRHVLVDTLGLVLLVMVPSANIQDREGARQWLAAWFARSPRRRIKPLWADGGYLGSLVAWARRVWRCPIAMVQRADAPTFRVRPRRWVVERTFGWLGRYRRLNQDYERLAQTGETMV